MEPIASGRAADVFDAGDGTVLRRHRDGHAAADEARLMTYLHELGYPVPLVFSNDGPDLVMERIAGPTVLEELLREPTQIARYGRLLGELHDRLHRLPVPAWLSDVTTSRPRAGLAAAAPGRAGAHPAGQSILHLDLHPMNVILGVSGPVVIDWTNAAAGPAGLDVALTVVTVLGADLHTLDAPRPQLERLDASRVILIEAFLAACHADPAAELADAIAYRLADPGLSEAERDWLRTEAPTCLDRFAY